MNIAIEFSSPEEEAAFKAQAEAEGLSLGEWLKRIGAEHVKERASRPPLVSRIRKLWSDMPEDVRAEYPEGGARQIDHHVYGLPKR